MPGGEGRLLINARTNEQLAQLSLSDVLKAAHDQVNRKNCEVLDLPFNENSSFVQDVFTTHLPCETGIKKLNALSPSTNANYSENSLSFQRATTAKLQQQMLQLNHERDQILSQLQRDQDSSYIDAKMLLQLQDELLRVDAQIELIKELLQRKSVNLK